MVRGVGFEPHGEVLEKARKRYHENKEKHHAKWLARSIPIGDKCEICGATEGLEKHHPDYSKPLEVITLCRSCHMKLHMAKPS